jgi:hypothetical protein
MSVVYLNMKIGIGNTIPIKRGDFVYVPSLTVQK